MLEGPACRPRDRDLVYVEIILWTNEDGMLYSVEILAVHPSACGDPYRNLDPYRLFVDAANASPSELFYGERPGFD